MMAPAEEKVPGKIRKADKTNTQNRGPGDFQVTRMSLVSLGLADPGLKSINLLVIKNTSMLLSLI